MLETSINAPVKNLPNLKTLIKSLQWKFQLFRVKHWNHMRIEWYFWYWSIAHAKSPPIICQWRNESNWWENEAISVEVVWMHQVVISYDISKYLQCFLSIKMNIIKYFQEIFWQLTLFQAAQSSGSKQIPSTTQTILDFIHGSFTLDFILKGVCMRYHILPGDNTKWQWPEERSTRTWWFQHISNERKFHSASETMFWRRSTCTCPTKPSKKVDVQVIDW